MLDMDGNGHIDLHEALAAQRCASCGAHAASVSDFLRKAFKTADRDGDQRVTRDEFLAVFDELDPQFLLKLYRSPDFRRRRSRRRRSARTRGG